MPKISLDTTLSDLIRRASPGIDAHKRLAFVHDLGHCGLSITADVVRSEKFLYQDSVFTNTPRRALTSGNRDLRRRLAIKYLNVIPQRDAFISGNCTAVFFGTNARDARQMLYDRREAECTMAVLHQQQRPQLAFCAGPSDIPVLHVAADSSVDLIAGYKFAFDSLEDKGKGYSLLVDPEKHWLLNSKEALASSGLPTPRTEIIQVTGYPISASGCCQICEAAEAHNGIDSIPTIPKACVGQRGAWLKRQEKRVVSAVERRIPPFVMKTQQTFGGGGTWLVRSEQQKRELLRYLLEEEGGIIRRLLPLVNSANHHLHPGNMILSDMVQDPLGNYGATFFVTDTGGVLFMGVSEQILACGGKAWSGSTIDYNNQIVLQTRLQNLMEQTAGWLHREHGYCGPVGIDVLETTGDVVADVSQPRGNRALHIVDLNVRTSGSMSLPLLKGHFMRLGLFKAGLCTVASERGRWDFIKLWEREFLSGSMIVLSWYDDPQSRSSIGAVIVGAVDETSLRNKIRRLQINTNAVTF